MYYPFLDTCISQLEERFQNSELLGCFSSLLEARPDAAAQLDALYNSYSLYLDGTLTSLKAEVLRWQVKLTKQGGPVSPLKCLELANQHGQFPMISRLLQIFLSLPVTSASGERSFSALKYLKNYLRNSMTESRLNDLAHLFINKDIDLDYDHVIELFSARNRRLSL